MPRVIHPFCSVCGEPALVKFHPSGSVVSLAYECKCPCRHKVADAMTYSDGEAYLRPFYYALRVVEYAKELLKTKEKTLNLEGAVGAFDEMTKTSRY